MSDEKPADDLRSILSSSYDETMTSAAALDIGASAKPATEPAIETTTEQPTEAEPKAGDRQRGPDGKFLKKDGESEPKAADADDKAKAEAKTDDKAEPKADDTAAADKDPKTVEPKTDSKDPPANWSASDKAMFKLQPPEAQAFLLRRYREMEQGFTKKSEALANLQKEFGPIDEMFKPHLETLKARGLTPAATIRAWANVETALANGRGVDIIAGMIEGYNIDKAAVAKALGFTSTAAAQPDTDATISITGGGGGGGSGTASPAPIELPPALAEEIRQLRARLDAREQIDQVAKTQAARDREAAVEADITKFKSEANEAGELKHPFYEEVEPAMVALASSYVASKQPIPPLAELYETAVWANPSTRQTLLASQKAAEQAKAAEEARAKAARARNAGSSVTGAPGSGQATRQIKGEQTLREQLEEAAAELG